jgi:hypothetical protein
MDSQDLRRKLRDWMNAYANMRIHGTTKKVPWQELIDKERVVLLPLPDEEFALFQRCVRRVGINCHIHFENNYYSVPARLVGKDVTVRWNSELVRIIYAGEQVALHARCFTQGEYVTVRVHLPEHKRYSQTEHQLRFEEKMREIDEAAHEYFHMLLKAQPKYWYQTVRAILGLLEGYGEEVVNMGLKRALYYQATDVTTIKHILEKKLYLLELEPMLPKIEGENPKMGRDLTYYVVYDANSVPVTA